jgi:ABC-type methionine transport system ATPase subunit
MWTKRRVKLVYSVELLSQPSLSQLIKQFELVTNIREANVTSDHGWLVVDIEGSEEAVERGLAWATEQGLQVEALSQGAGPERSEGTEVR